MNPTVHFLVPEGLADPARPSGGNHYGMRVVDELTIHVRACEM